MGMVVGAAGFQRLQEQQRKLAELER
eukprot:COSAG02_NODE_15575_length_1159_cov_1.092453_3_plen_25_part_01